jgi:hypothetical protein
VELAFDCCRSNTSPNFQCDCTASQMGNQAHCCGMARRG